MFRYAAFASWFVAILVFSPATPAGTPHDVVLLIDNSGSMRNVDRNLLMRRIAGKFVRDSRQDAAVAIGIFSDTTELLMPLSPVSEPLQKAQLVAKLDRLGYHGRRTNIPDAVTKAMDELNLHGRPDALKYIILLTDGIVDTGGRLQDQEGTEWLREVATRDASRDGIRIISIALAGDTDEVLLRQLAERTDGVFFSVRRVAELPAIFDHIGNLFTAQYEQENNASGVAASTAPAGAKFPSASTTDKSEQAAGAGEEQAAASTPASADPAPKSTSALPASKRNPLSFDRIGNKLILGTSLSLLLLSAGAWLALRSRPRLAYRSQTATLRNAEASVHTEPEQSSSLSAYLLDITGVTGRSSYRLSERRTMIGRVHPEISEAMGSIVVDAPSIGRRHALIERRRGGYWIIDQNSKNGTFINGRLVREPTYLLHGDRLRLHHVEFEFALRGLGSDDITIAMDDQLPEVSPTAPEPSPRANADDATTVTETAGATAASLPARKGSAQTAKERLFAEVGSRSTPVE